MVRPYPCSCRFDVAVYALYLFFRLARGSILASVIRIMPGSPLRTGSLYVSGLFVVFYVVIIAQFIWVCQGNFKSSPAGYAPFF
jgi:hypothetical protein